MHAIRVSAGDELLDTVQPETVQTQKGERPNLITQSDKIKTSDRECYDRDLLLCFQRKNRIRSRHL